MQYIYFNSKSKTFRNTNYQNSFVMIRYNIMFNEIYLLQYKIIKFPITS